MLVRVNGEVIHFWRNSSFLDPREFRHITLLERGGVELEVTHVYMYSTSIQTLTCLCVCVRVLTMWWKTKDCHTKHYCVMPLHYRVMPLHYRVMPLHYRVMPLRYRVIPLHYRVMPLHYRVIPIHYRVIPLHYRVIPLHYRVMPIHYRVMPLHWSTTKLTDGFLWQSYSVECLGGRGGVSGMALSKSEITCWTSSEGGDEKTLKHMTRLILQLHKTDPNPYKRQDTWRSPDQNPQQVERLTMVSGLGGCTGWDALVSLSLRLFWDNTTPHFPTKFSSTYGKPGIYLCCYQLVCLRPGHCWQTVP